jgi:photosystem II stability/assembly factor-like uncharacterized protein
MRVSRVSYLTESTIVLVGQDSNLGGICFRSTDGGWNWSPVTENIPFAVEAISFADSLHGFLAGGAISTTSDGGRTWQHSSMIGGIRGISAADRLRATVVTAGGGSSHTTDGGVTWIPVSTNSTGALYAVHHPTVQTATAIGFRGTILRMTTTDEPLSSVRHVASASPEFISSIYPNPARNSVSVKVELSEYEDVALNLYTVEGIFVRALFAGAAATDRITCDLQGLGAGKYILRGTTRHRTEYHPLIIIH